MTASLMQQPGPIATSIDVLRIDIPAATIVGDAATIDDVAISYATHFAPGSWHEERVEGVTMCRFELRRVKGRWLVEDETCKVSGR